MPAIEITVTGNLARDPDLKVIGDGTPLATFTVASNERRKNGDGEWVDGPTSWIRCCAWDELAEHVTADLRKGDRVIVHGTLRQRDYEAEARDGQPGGKRTTWEVTAADAGPSLKFAPAKIASDDKDQ